MKKTGKRIVLCLLAALLLMVQLPRPAAAAAEDPAAARKARIQEAAQALYDLNLIAGVGTNPDGTPNFNLEQPFTRGEGVTMITALLGGRDEALSGKFENPYTDDLGWAEPYVLYATAHDLVSGVGNGKFAQSDRMDIRQFLVLVLRMLGYWGPDADWKDTPNLASARGIDVPDQWYAKDFRYTRGDAILACYTALDVLVGEKESLTTFRYTMEQKGIIPSDRLFRTDFTWGKLAPTNTEVSVNSLNELYNPLFEAIRGLAYPITIRVSGASRDQIFDFLHNNKFAVRKTSALGWEDHTNLSVEYLTHEMVMSYLTGRTNDLTADARKLMEAALKLHPTLVDPSMDEYAQVVAFHDYIINNTKYSSASKRIGTLTQGIGVCEDYSMTFQLLCWLSGIDCMYITGTANGGNAGTGGHAWNKVKVDGNWYNIDVSFDDPVLSNGADDLLYDFFLKSDDEFAKDHTPDPNPYWPACPESWTFAD